MQSIRGDACCWTTALTMHAVAFAIVCSVERVRNLQRLYCISIGRAAHPSRKCSSSVLDAPFGLPCYRMAALARVVQHARAVDSAEARIFIRQLHASTRDVAYSDAMKLDAVRRSLSCACVESSPSQIDEVRTQRLGSGV
jgi:hypothetical protein